MQNGKLAILVGDVAGHGVAAALIMVKFGVEARVILEREQDLASAIAQLNQRMCAASRDDRLVTLVALVLDPVTHTVILVNAGHPSPMLVRHSDGSVEEATPRAVSGYFIGLMKDVTFQNHSIQLLPGDQLFLFTDGITEARDRNKNQFHVEGLKKVLSTKKRSLSDTGEKIMEAVGMHAFHCEQSDDILLVGVGRTAIEPAPMNNYQSE